MSWPHAFTVVGLAWAIAFVLVKSWEHERKGGKPL